MASVTVSKPTPVTAGLIFRETPDGLKILIARRKSDAPVEAGKWEFPGGKLEPLEHPKECLAREIREELDLEIEVGDIFEVTSHIYETPKGPLHVLLMFYLCQAKSEHFKKVQVADARWISPTELDEFAWAIADIPALNKLKSFLTKN